MGDTTIPFIGSAVFRVVGRLSLLTLVRGLMTRRQRNNITYDDRTVHFAFAEGLSSHLRYFFRMGLTPLFCSSIRFFILYADVGKQIVTTTTTVPELTIMAPIL